VLGAGPLGPAFFVARAALSDVSDRHHNQVSVTATTTRYKWLVLRRPPAHHLWAATVRVGDERVLPIGSLQGRRYTDRGVARRQHAACDGQ
jgi:hypothetical protein